MSLDHPSALGATLNKNGADFSVWSRHASQIELCLFDPATGAETARMPMVRDRDDIHRLSVTGVEAGQRYGYRAHGVYSPPHGLWHDAAKLLVDPYATELDSPFSWAPDLSLFGYDTARLVPKAILRQHEEAALAEPLFDVSGLIYEVNVRALTMRHPDIPPAIRGTVAALAHPAMLAHYKRLGVSTLELMPIVAWIDERHLPPLGLSNAWGYNPVALMALDPRLVPGGVAELRATVDALHKAGIGVVLDLVFNHTGESDRLGPTLSMRGLDNLAYYRHGPNDPGSLINDSGCGNTIACDEPMVGRLIIDSLAHFVRHAGVDGFRFDLAPILARTPHGFDPNADFFTAIAAHPLLSDRVMIAEPWDVGIGGYQLGNFPARFWEWNDRARDDLRMVWRGDRNKIGVLATVLSGSSDIFARNGATHTRTVNFIAAHDGFTLADLVSHERKHNDANGEHNRDGHNENHSWNNGVEGPTGDPVIRDARRRDIRALLATLMLSRGAVMLTAGDEMGRSQQGNNNAYAQDNAMTWLDWAGADANLLAHLEKLASIRRRYQVFSETAFFTGADDVTWLNQHGQPMSVDDWQHPDADHLTMCLKTVDRTTKKPTELAIIINRAGTSAPICLPGDRPAWTCLLGNDHEVEARSVSVLARPIARQKTKR